MLMTWANIFCSLILISISCGNEEGTDNEGTKAGQPTSVENEKVDSPNRVIDLIMCETKRYSEKLLFGYGYWQTYSDEDSNCEIWLGGQIENPSYNGEPLQYCSFKRDGTATVEIRELGLPTIEDDNSCTTKENEIPEMKT